MKYTQKPLISLIKHHDKWHIVHKQHGIIGKYDDFAIASMHMSYEYKKLEIDQQLEYQLNRWNQQF